MIYTYYCKDIECNHSQDENHSVNGFKEFQPPCGKCGKLCEYRYTPSIPQVAFKDGPTGSWPSKGNRYKQYREKRDGEMKRRQRDRYGEAKQLIPNYNGQITESWREAQSLASQDKNKESDMRAASANTFNDRVSNEPKKIIV